METSQLSRDCLGAKDIPIHKSGSGFGAKNDRPHLTCTACKAMEPVIGKQLQLHMGENNRIYYQLQRFRRDIFKLTQLFKTMQHAAIRYMSLRWSLRTPLGLGDAC